MCLKSLLTSHDSYLRRFFLVAISVLVLLLILSSFASYKLYERYVIRLAESNAANLTSAIVDARYTALLNVLNSPIQEPEGLSSLDSDLRAFVKPYSIVKIKMFSLSGIVVYSTDISLLGSSSAGNENLDKALAGGSSSSIQTKDKIADLADETRFDVDVVESYVPMYGFDNKVIGVFEIYQDMTRFRAEVKEGVVSFTVGFGLLLIVLLLGAFYFIKSSARKMLVQQKQFEQFATIDPVTNVFNRGEITRQMESEWERFSRAGSDQKGFGLMMLDLDHFKRVNDDYGHQIGDELLKRIAHRLQGELRIYSQLGRYGGEEFVVLLPEVTMVELNGIADRILKLISEKPFTIQTNEIFITLSIGLAIAKRSDLNVDAVLKRADDNLYMAKDAGRNRKWGE
ncbi:MULTISPECIES: GGDEF domain-containing protein [unclassified Neptuniibacter]|uniref:GGDEF domain-containing protein n=1 Tax=unclassified Neptuniibacter TaxID=2630693 RepID=UPI000C397560|nr:MULTISPECIES: GGDEF domain-containing protein [unclassified Neptuniibacter]MAY42993.1 hypothetical protein [Oceanospirillaceae bacterium]